MTISFFWISEKKAPQNENCSIFRMASERQKDEILALEVGKELKNQFYRNFSRSTTIFTWMKKPELELFR